jgi:hypothetical protein
MALAHDAQFAHMVADLPELVALVVPRDGQLPVPGLPGLGV